MAQHSMLMVAFPIRIRDYPLAALLTMLTLGTLLLPHDMPLKSLKTVNHASLGTAAVLELGCRRTNPYRVSRRPKEFGMGQRATWTRDVGTGSILSSDIRPLHVYGRAH